MADKPFIFFDLDGTLLDSRNRVYFLFQHLVPTSGLSFDEYWNEKKRGVSHRQLLEGRFSYSDGMVQEFEKEWMGLIEDQAWLDHDHFFGGVPELLDTLVNEFRIALITARQSFEPVIMQLKKSMLDRYFSEVLVTRQLYKKEELLIGREFPVGSWAVGDSGEDIMLGKMFSMKTAAVLSGFKSREYLSRYGPDHIVDEVAQLRG